MLVKLTISVPPEVVTLIQEMAVKQGRSMSNMSRHLLSLGVNSVQYGAGKDLINLNVEGPSAEEDESSYTSIVPTKAANIEPTKPEIVIPEMFKRQENQQQSAVKSRPKSPFAAPEGTYWDGHQFRKLEE